MVHALGQLKPDEESADFEPEHLNVIARVLIDYEWRDPSVYEELRREVTAAQMA